MTVGYDDLATSYGRHRRCNRDVVDALVMAGGLTAASSVLEVGAGTGNHSLALRERTRRTLAIEQHALCA